MEEIQMSIKALEAFFGAGAFNKARNADLFLPNTHNKNRIFEISSRKNNRFKFYKNDVFWGNRRQTTIVKYDFSQYPVITAITTKTKNFIDGKLVYSDRKTEYQHERLFCKELFSGLFRLFDKNM